MAQSALLDFLSFLTSHGMFTVYRTRDVDIISKAKNDGKHIVYDVGGFFASAKTLKGAKMLATLAHVLYNTNNT